MLDAIARKSFQVPMDSIASKVLASGMAANGVTLAGLLLGLIGCFLVALGLYLPGLLFILLNRFFDGLAAAMARSAGVTARGSFLDAVSDFIVFGAFGFAFALSAPEHLLAACFLLFSYLVMAVAFFAHRLFSPVDGTAETERFRGGLIGGAEITIFMILSCAYAPGFSAFAAFMGLLCWVTAALRIRKALQDF